MRFLILTQYFAPEIGAAPVRLAGLARELIRRGHAVEVVTALPNHPHGRILPGYRGALWRDAVEDGMRVHRVWLYASTGAGVGRLANYGSFLLSSLAGLRQAGRPDYVVVETPPPTVALAGAAAARRWGARLILNVSDLWPDSIAALDLLRNRGALRALAGLERWMYRRADFVTAVTRGIREALIARKGVAAERVLYLPNGLDLELFHPREPDLELKARLGLSEVRHAFVYAGTMGYAHALEKLLDAAALMGARSGAHFLLIGDGSERGRLEAEARRRNLRNVSFHAAVPPGELPRYLSFATAALVPQRGVPLFDGNRPAKLLAMMGCGAAVVFCGNGEGAALVREAQAGLVAPPEDPPALAEALGRLAGDPALAAECGRSGRRFAEARYGWPRLVGAWLEELQAQGAAAAAV